MSLFDVKRKLYKKDLTENISEHGKTAFDVTDEKTKVDEKKYFTNDAWKGEKRGLTEEQKKALKAGGIALVVIICTTLLLVAFYQVKKSAFSESNVIVSVKGPSEADSGKPLAYEISYKNSNRVSLKNAVIRLEYPEGFKPDSDPNFKVDGLTASSVNLGEVAAFSEGKIVFKGKAYSPKGALMYIKSSLNYVPSNFSSQFSSKSQIGVSITSSPINIEIQGPLNMSSGDSLDYVVSYKNNGAEIFNDIRIKVDYPDGYTFSKAVPAVSEGNNIWYLGSLPAGQEGKIIISGKLEGQRDQVKNANVYIGTIDQGQFVSYSEEKAETKIVGSPFAISQTVNGLANINANAGDVLRFIVNYKNEGNLGLRDVIITEKLDSPLLDYTTLDLEKGSYDSSNKIITWKASDFPALKNLNPGVGGSVSFNVKIKDVLPVAGEQDKNFVISSVAKIDSPDIPTPIQMNKIIAGNKMDIKLNSKLVLDVKGYYNDPNIPNSGPIPPQVGQDTTYTMHWAITNVNNDITDASIQSVLPTGIVYTGKVYPEDANFSYNERNNSLVWNMGNIKAGTGILSSPKEIAFQIKIHPSPNQGGSMASLLNASSLSAKDAFTGNVLSASGSEKTTSLWEDKSLTGDAYKIKAGT